MQPDYFEIAKNLMIEQGQQMIDRLKQAEKVAESILIQCENCRDYFEPDDIIEFNGLNFCSEDCAMEHEAKNVEVDNTCYTCRGTGEGQNEYSSCPACRGKGIVISKKRCEP